MVIEPDYLLRRNMKWPGSAKAVLCLLVLIQLSCHQWMVNATWPHPPCNDQNFAITADNKLEMYVDGVQVTSLTHPNSPSIADIVPLSGSAKVIAITGKNSGEHGGFLGSAGNFVTDGSWKCTDQFHDGWQEVNFDDSSWPGARVVGLHGCPPWHHVEGISLFAYWIWVSTDYSGPDKKKDVYCRKKIECEHQTTTRRQRTTRGPTTKRTTTPRSTTRSTHKITHTTTPGPTTPGPTTPGPTTPAPTTPAPTTPAPTTPAPTTPAPTTPAPTTPAPTTPAPTTPAPTTPAPTTPAPTTPAPTTPAPTTHAPPTPAPPTPAPPTHAPPTPAPPTPAPPTHAPPTPAPPTPAPPTHAPPTPAPPSCNGGSGETGPSCITSCSGRANGDYQSCKGCKVYASCSNGILYDNRPCPAGLYWDDNVKRCEWESTTCKECE